MSAASATAKITKTFRQPSTWRTIRRWSLGLLLLLSLAAGVVVWYVRSGHLARQIEQAYTASLPGNLTIGAITVRGYNKLLFKDVSICAPGHEDRPLVTVPRITVLLDYAKPGYLDQIIANGIGGHLDRINYDLLDAIILEMSKTPPSNVSWQLICDGGCSVENGPTASGVTVEGPIEGGQYDLDCKGYLGGQPIAVRVYTEPSAGGAKRLSIDLLSVTKQNTHGFLAGAETLGLLPATPPGLRAWIPEVMDFTGSVIHCDMVDNLQGRNRPPAWSVPIRAAWTGGTLTTQMSADERRIAFTAINLDDPVLGRCKDGAVTLDMVADTLEVTLPSQWAPGTQAPIPAEVPVADLLAVMPAAQATIVLADGRESVAVALQSRDRTREKARLAFAWQVGAPLRIDGAELPLALIRNWLGDGVEASGGLAAALRVTLDLDKPLDDSLRDCWLRFVQARIRVGDWTFGPADGECAIRPSGPLSTAPCAATLSLTRPLGPAQATIAQLAWTGTLASGDATWEVRELEGLMARLKGPVPPPGLRGSLAGVLHLDRSPDAVVVSMSEVTVRGLAVAWPSAQGLRDLLHSVDAQIRGELAWRNGELKLQAGGHLQRGTLIIPGTAIDLAARKPLFTVAARVPAGADVAVAVTIDELLVRSSNADGVPDPEGFSLQVSGQIDPTGTGTLKGLVDQADLGWIHRTVPQLVGVLKGRAAIVGHADLVNGEIVQVVADLLPLSIELRLGVRLVANGVTGAIHFTLTRPSGPNPEP